MQIDFSKVVLGSRLDLALVGQAAQEGFLSPGADEALVSSGRKTRFKQDALILLVLFDQLVLPDLVGGNYEIPILEREGIVQTYRSVHLSCEDFAESDWFRNRNPESFIKALDRTISVRPLVVEYMARKRFEFVAGMASLLQCTQRQLINAMIDFAHSHYLQDEDGIRCNPVLGRLPTKVLKKFRKDLVSQPPSDLFNPFDVIIFGATHAAALLEHYRVFSESMGLGVATNEFTGRGSLWHRAPQLQEKIERLPESFTLMQVALTVEGAFFPRIESIKHALQLRRDPNLRSFREQLSYFQQTVMRGDGSDAFRLAKEVQRSANALKKITRIERGLKWLTYISLPTSVVETFLNGLPVASTSLSALAIGGTLYANRADNKHRWVLFGRTIV